MEENAPEIVEKKSLRSSLVEVVANHVLHQFVFDPIEDGGARLQDALEEELTAQLAFEVAVSEIVTAESGGLYGKIFFASEDGVDKTIDFTIMTIAAAADEILDNGNE